MADRRMVHEIVTSLVSDTQSKANPDEWWGTFDPDTMVLDMDGVLYVVTARKLKGRYPNESPGEVEEQGLPHPFGWSKD